MTFDNDKYISGYLDTLCLVGRLTSVFCFRVCRCFFLLPWLLLNNLHMGEM